MILKDSTFPNQALFYGLCFNNNILHADPKIAAKLGYRQPIIHGLATYGIIARNIVQNVLGNDP